MPDLRPGHIVILNLDGQDGEPVSSSENLKIGLISLSHEAHAIEATVLGEDENAFAEME